MACISQSRGVCMLPSDKVIKLMTKLVSVVAVALDLIVFVEVVLFHVVHVCFIIVVADDLNIDINLVNNRLSCILAIVSAGVVAPDIIDAKVKQ